MPAVSAGHLVARYPLDVAAVGAAILRARTQITRPLGMSVDEAVGLAVTLAGCHDPTEFASMTQPHALE